MDRYEKARYLEKQQREKEEWEEAMARFINSNDVNPLRRENRDLRNRKLRLEGGCKYSL